MHAILEFPHFSVHMRFVFSYFVGNQVRHNYGPGDIYVSFVEQISDGINM